jgi:hypothetical protein
MALPQFVWIPTDFDMWLGKGYGDVDMLDR